MLNPYDAPASVEADPKPRSRPFGVYVLIVFFLLGAVGMLVQIAQLAHFAFRDPRAMAVIVPGNAFFVIVATASAVGMWQGAKWGWWLAAFHNCYNMLRNVLRLMAVFISAPSVHDAMHSPDFISTIVIVTLGALILLYLFRANVRRFFRLEKTSKLKALVILFGLSIATAVIPRALGQLLS